MGQLYNLMSPTQATIYAKPQPPALPYERCDLEAIFLPVKQMLQIERVIKINEKGLVCEMDIAGHWVFPVHFPADPIFPGTLLIEAAGQAIAVWAWNAGFRGRPRLGRVAAKFLAPVLPRHSTVTLVASVRQRKCVFAGVVELFVSEGKVAEIKPVVFIIPEPALAQNHLANNGQRH
jgi:3-hydroxymyristoyl/3-hydroxydecanoyl-(acyl carrier protein) dehydratase